MAKGQHLSGYQRGIVNRYYQHRDTIMTSKLSEIVGELYLCDSEKKGAAMWKTAEQALAKTDADPARVARILAKRDVQELARLVNELSGS